MRTTVGTFTSQAEAVDAIGRLRALGLADDRLNLLLPEDYKEHIHQVPTTDTERPGVGKAFGGVVGAITGIAAANIVLPEVWPVADVGFAIMVLCAIGGAVVGIIAGRALDHRLTEGLPKDELFVYEDALRQGRSVVVVLTDDAQRKAARREMARAGAETIDAARKKWWLGLRRAESETYKV